VVVLFSCQWPDGSNGPYAGAELHLEQLSVTCTEVWLKVGLAGVDSAGQGSLGVELKRNDTTVASFSFLPPDTIVKDAGLEPGHMYRYRVYRGSGAGSPSPELSVTTLDTTSHDFVWEIDTLGDYGSYLNDVAIINENDIWAVGYLEVSEYDSAGNRHQAFYNAAHWDGDNWKLLKIQPPNFLFGPINAVKAFLFSSDSVIWFASSIGIRWDGESFIGYGVANGWPYGVGYIHSIWGSVLMMCISLEQAVA